MKNVCTFLIVLLLFGCDADSVKQRVDSTIKEADIQLEEDYKESRNDFLKAYPKALESVQDASRKIKITNYRISVLSSLAFADSLKGVISKMDSSDPNTYKDVQKVFVEDKAGRYLFEKLRTSYQLTKELAITAERKSEIEISYNKAFNGYDDKEVKDLFEVNNPEGVKWMLCGIEKELLTLGIHVLQDNTDPH